MSPALDGYPTPWGASFVSVITLTGPASYSQFTAPSTGGQDVRSLPEAGPKTVDFAIGGSSDDGTHRVEVVHYEAGAVPGGASLANATFVLKWYVIATGSEVAGAVDLSGQTVRVLVIGPK